MKRKQTIHKIMLSNRQSLIYFSLGALLSTFFVHLLVSLDKDGSPDYNFKGKSINTILFAFVFLILFKCLEAKDSKQVKCQEFICKHKGFCHDSMDVLFGMLGSFFIITVSHFYSRLFFNFMLSLTPILLFIILKYHNVWPSFAS